MNEGPACAPRGQHRRALKAIGEDAQVKLRQKPDGGDVVDVVLAFVPRPLGHGEQAVDGAVADEGEQQREGCAVRPREHEPGVCGVGERRRLQPLEPGEG